MQVVELAEIVGRGQVEAHLLQRLATGGGQRIGVARVDPPAGQGHVPRPGIARPPGPLDEQQLGPPLAVPEHRGDRRPPFRRWREHRAAGGEGDAEALQIAYQPSVPFEVPTAEHVAGAFAARLKALAGQERARQMSLAGPHRDDIDLQLDGRSLAAYGSQGQQRTAVLALKVAEYSVMHERSGEAPLLLLDDVLSELDPARAHAFLSGVGGFEQAFITATHVPEGLPQARLYTIESARIREAA